MMDCFRGDGWGLGMGMGMGMEMGLGWVWMILFWGLVITGIVALVRWVVAQPGGAATAPGTASGMPAGTPTSTPLTILQERYARGEIDRAEYETKRRDLSGGQI